MINIETCGVLLGCTREDVWDDSKFAIKIKEASSLPSGHVNDVGVEARWLLSRMTISHLSLLMSASGLSFPVAAGGRLGVASVTVNEGHPFPFFPSSQLLLVWAEDLQLLRFVCWLPLLWNLWRFKTDQQPTAFLVFFSSSKNEVYLYFPYWSIIALQCCVSFCHTTASISSQ